MARIDVVPAATAVTSPRASTVATFVLVEAHIIVFPVSAVPDASFGVAVSCVVCWGRSVASALTVTVATVAVGCVVPESPLLLHETAGIVISKLQVERKDRAVMCVPSGERLFYLPRHQL
jgi:hypothetical protein